MKTFAQLYAAQNGLPPGEAERDIFLRCLHPHARLLRPLLDFAVPLNFSADRDLIRNVALLTDPHEFRYDAAAHRHHPEAGGLWRRGLLLRVSMRRLHHLVWTTFHPAPATPSRWRHHRSTAPSEPSARDSNLPTPHSTAGGGTF